MGATIGSRSGWGVTIGRGWASSIGLVDDPKPGDCRLSWGSPRTAPVASFVEFRNERRCSFRSPFLTVARGGVEPPTFHFSGERYYQLSYLAVATPTGLEPATSAVTGRRANQLRYGA